MTFPAKSRWRLAVGRTGGLAALLSLLLVAIAARAGDAFHVEHLTAARQDGTVVVNGQLSVGKGALLQDILDKGVTLYWIQRLELREPGHLLFVPRRYTVAHLEHVWKVRYHPLTRQYLLDDPATGARRIFASWESLYRVLGEVRDLRLAIPPDTHPVSVRFKAYVDVAALPLPLRLRSVLGHWKLTAPWKSVALPP